MSDVNLDTGSSAITQTGGGIAGGVSNDTAEEVGSGIFGTDYQAEVDKWDEAIKFERPVITDPRGEACYNYLSGAMDKLMNCDDIESMMIEVVVLAIQARKDERVNEIACNWASYANRMKASFQADIAADKRFWATVVAKSMDAVAHMASAGLNAKIGASNTMSESAKMANSAAASAATGVISDLGGIAGAELNNQAEHQDNIVKRTNAQAELQEKHAEESQKLSEDELDLIKAVIQQIIDRAQMEYQTNCELTKTA